jgi:uncharacterized surface protein with fasciclin (FAS1) repeats
LRLESSTPLTCFPLSGLADTLKTGNYTVFAPTDAAFAKLPAGTVEGLLKVSLGCAGSRP